MTDQAAPSPSLSDDGENLLASVLLNNEDVPDTIGGVLFNDSFEVEESMLPCLIDVHHELGINFLRRLFCYGKGCEAYFASIKKPPMYCNYVWV